MPKLAPSALALVLAAALAPAAHAATQQDTASSAVLLQGFHWNSPNYRSPDWYTILASKAADMKDLGVSHVWFPPPSDSADLNGYLPRQLNVLSSHYGSEVELKSAVGALAAQGIQSVADVVINHRVGTTGWADFTNPTWDCRAVVSNDEWSGHCGNADTGEGYGAARDIDHTQDFVRADLIAWVGTRLKDIGFTGVRFDFAKGYAPKYGWLYQHAMGADFCVGEVWTTLDLNNVDAHRQQLMNYISSTGETCAAFDFTTHGLLVQALSYNDYGRLRDAAGKPAGGIGWWPQKIVTFVDNHDTGPSENAGNGQRRWPIPADSVMQAYAYVLTHPGIPSVYYPHVYDWGLRGGIKALIAARSGAGVNSASSVSIEQATTGLYAAIITGSKGKLAMKIGPNSWSPSGSGWTQLTSGNNYAVWSTQGGSTCSAKVTFSIANANTVLGENLYLAGNQGALGNWQPASAFPLTIQGSGANATWSGTVSLPCNTPVQYKYIKRNPSTGATTWEANQPTASGNREFTPVGGSQSRNDGSF